MPWSGPACFTQHQRHGNKLALHIPEKGSRRVKLTEKAASSFSLYYACYLSSAKWRRSKSSQQCSLSVWENDMFYRKQPENDTGGAHTATSWLSFQKKERCLERHLGRCPRVVFGSGLGRQRRGWSPLYHRCVCPSSHANPGDVARDEKKMALLPGRRKDEPGAGAECSKRSTKWPHAMFLIKSESWTVTSAGGITRGRVQWRSRFGKELDSP